MEVEQADVLKWAAWYSGPKFHALLTDCPYEYGFMAKSWDKKGISFQPKTWEALADHLLPGAFGMTFGGARTWHRIAVAIEDAGLIIHPAIFGWSYGSGFPKATRIDTQIDKAATPNDEVQRAKAELGRWLREKRGNIPQKEIAKHFLSKTGGLTGCVANWELGFNLPTWDIWLKLKEILSLDSRYDYLIEGRPSDYIEAEREVIGKDKARSDETWFTSPEWDITAPATPLAQAWAGHRYGLQALKPALEPIIVFQRPYEGRPVECITSTGSGALWIDGGRIPSGGDGFSEGEDFQGWCQCDED